MTILLLLILLSSFTAGKNLEVPDSTSQPTSNIVCFPIHWYSVAVFFLVNYVAHAATIKPLPGQTNLFAFLDFLAAVFLPYSGLYKGAGGIWRSSLFSCKRWEKVWDQPGILPKWKEFRNCNQLEEAARAGALAVIVRSERWFPLPNQVVKLPAASLKPLNESHWGSAVSLKFPTVQQFSTGETSTSTSIQEVTTTEVLEQEDLFDGKRRIPVLPEVMMESPFIDPCFGEMRRVHGLLHLPNEYTIAILPSNAKVEFNGQNDDYRPYFTNPQPITDRTYHRSVLSSNFNLPRALIAVVQVVFALYSLTTPSHTAEINKYGFAAFSLTVVPYLVMSLTNLIGNLITPSYPALYLVRSEEMEEAERHGAKFDGVVGSLDQTGVSDDILTATFTGFWYEFNDLGGVPVDMSEGAKHVFSPFACSPFRTNGTKRLGKPQIWYCLGFCVFLTLIPLTVFGGLTRFKGKESASLDQISTMLWFGVDCLYGLFIPIAREYLLRVLLKMRGPRSVAFDGDPEVNSEHESSFHQRYATSATKYEVAVFFGVLLLFGPSVWGFVSVAKMLNDWGACYYLK